jgi:mycofactocin system glycosyltransferase
VKAATLNGLEHCYKLESHLKLQLDGKVALIYSYFPLFVTRTTPQIIALLDRCDGQTSVAELARQVKLKPASVLKALEELHARGFLRLEVSEQLLDDADLPAASIVIPVYNRPADLKRCLDALLKLDYPANKLEIIVVDDASTDKTSEVAARYPVRLLRNEKQLGPAGSRNRAVAAASHDLIACVDSDCVVTQDWLRQIVGVFEDAQVVAVGGATHAYQTESLLQRYENVCSSLFMGQRPAEVRLQSTLSYLPTCNLAFRRSVFLAADGFDPNLRFGEDVDFCWRLLKAGWRIRYHPAAQLSHAYRNDWRGFLKTRVDYASSEAALVARHPDKRRTLFLPLWALLSWLGVLVALGWRKPWPLLFSAGLPFLKALHKWRNLDGYKLPLAFSQVVLAEYRSHTVAGYHFATHLGKYYSLLLAGGLLPRRSRLPVSLVLLGPVVADYFRLKPRLNLLVFLAISLLENFFYQFGVVVGGLRHKNLAALLPKIQVQKH